VFGCFFGDGGIAVVKCGWLICGCGCGCGSGC